MIAIWRTGNPLAKVRATLKRVTAGQFPWRPSQRALGEATLPPPQRCEDRRRAAFASPRRTIFTDLRVRDASGVVRQRVFISCGSTANGGESPLVGRSLVRCAHFEFLLICAVCPATACCWVGSGPVETKGRCVMANNQEENPRTSLLLGLDRANPSFSPLKSFLSYLLPHDSPLSTLFYWRALILKS